MPGERDIIVIGASAGGIPASQALLACLPRDIPATIFVVLHLAQVYAATASVFQSNPDTRFPADALSRRSGLPVHAAVDSVKFQRGHVYVAVSDEHLLVERGRIRLEGSPKETWFRPSVDVLFRSAASAYGRRVVGVVLSGLLRDGTVGLWHVKKHGGVTVVQDPLEAQHSQMPQSAIDSVPIDYCLPVKDIAHKLVELASEQPALGRPRGPRSAKVLIVEDERVVALNLEKRLSKLGYQVCGSVSSGEAAIELAAETGPDIVLMDIRLPGISGREAARFLWDRFQVPVIYVTAYADTATIDEIKTTETYGYVMKPFRSHEVDAAIQLALERRSTEVRES